MLTRMPRQRHGKNTAETLQNQEKCKNMLYNISENLCMSEKSSNFAALNVAKRVAQEKGSVLLNH